MTYIQHQLFQAINFFVYFSENQEFCNFNWTANFYAYMGNLKMQQ